MRRHLCNRARVLLIPLPLTSETVQPPELPPNHIGTATAARRLGVSERTVRRMCERGQLSGATQFGYSCTWLIPPAALDSLTGPLSR